MPRFTLYWVPANSGEGTAFSGWRLYREGELVSEWGEHPDTPTHREYVTARRLAENKIRSTFGYRVTEWVPSLKRGGFSMDAESV